MATRRGNGTDEETLVFVYGTLKRGFPNHHLLEDLIRSSDAASLSQSETLLPYPLVVGPLSIPYLLHLPGSGLPVRGELYSVSSRGLARLDLLEGVAYSHYQRLPVRVSSAGGAAVMDAQAYFGHQGFAEELWRRCGEGAAVAEYSARAAGEYVRPTDRDAGLDLLGNIRAFLASHR